MAAKPTTSGLYLYFACVLTVLDFRPLTDVGRIATPTCRLCPRGRWKLSTGHARPRRLRRFGEAAFPRREVVLTDHARSAIRDVAHSVVETRDGLVTYRR